MIRVGLRFQRADATLLWALAERVKSMELGQRDVATFENAARAADSGEPLIAYCSSPEEAQVLAAGYTQYGVAAPIIDDIFSTGI